MRLEHDLRYCELCKQMYVPDAVHGTEHVCDTTPHPPPPPPPPPPNLTLLDITETEQSKRKGEKDRRKKPRFFFPSSELEVKENIPLAENKNGKRGASTKCSPASRFHCIFCFDCRYVCRTLLSFRHVFVLITSG